MQRRVSIAAVALASCLFACGRPPVKINLRAVLDEASLNLTGPTARLKEGPVEIHGVVDRAGIRPFREVKKDGPSEASSTDQYPFLLIVPGDARPGRCMCFFEMADIDAVMDHKPGMQITVVAKFDSFVVQDQHTVLVADCTLVK
jgi:hypothetical protein